MIEDDALKLLLRVPWNLPFPFPFPFPLPFPFPFPIPFPSARVEDEEEDEGTVEFLFKPIKAGLLDCTVEFLSSNMGNFCERLDAAIPDVL